MPKAAFGFRLTSADRDFTWCEEKYQGMPIIRHPDGTVSQPFTFYFAYLARTRSESISSMATRSYTLREWAEFLWGQGLDLKSGGRDATLHRFVAAQKERGIEENQANVKIRRVYEFYLHLPDALRYWEDGAAVEEFVGTCEERRPITTKTTYFKGRAYVRWSGQGKISQTPARPSVLDDDEADAVCAAARDVPVDNQMVAANSEPEDPARRILIGERNWLLANCMAKGGLRAAETCDVTCTAVTDALRMENLLKSVEARVGRIHSIADIGDNQEAQDILLNSLKSFEHRKRRMFIYVDITGKGSKRRKAAFPIALIRDILTVGIWTVRRLQILELSGSRSACPDTVFLSFKTAKQMLPGTVSDIMKAAFVRARINGSGHDLRKYYGTTTANRILKRTLDDLGYLTHAVLNTVYEQVASALGHASVTTTTRHYVNVATVNYTGLEARRQRSKILTIWEELISQQDQLDAERIRLCGTAIRSIAKAPKGSDLYEIVRGVLTDPEINPDGMIKFAIPKPNLKLVVSNTV